MTSNDEWVRDRAKWTAERAMSPTWQEHGVIAPLIEAALQEAIERGKKNVLARLTNPDEALVEAMNNAIRAVEGNSAYGFELRAACKALAVTLAVQENTDGK